MLSVDHIADRLRLAADAVESANLPDDLRPIAYEHALCAVGLDARPAAGPVSEADATSPRSRSAEATHADLLTQIADRFGLSVDGLDRIYDVSDGSVRLAIRRGMLPDADRKAAAMRDVTLLTIAGRQAAGEEQTPLSVAREECQALNVLDSTNFATEIGKLDLRLSGGRNSRVARANRHHMDEAAALIAGILEGAPS